MDTVKRAIQLSREQLAKWTEPESLPNSTTAIYALAPISEEDEEEETNEHKDVEAFSNHDMQITTYAREVRIFLGFVGPVFLNQLLARYCTVLGPVSAMGRFGSVYLGGASLANTTLNILGIAPTLGITSALDTLSTQAHGGSNIPGGRARDLNMLYTLRVALVSVICLTPLVVLMCIFEPIFLMLHVEPDAAKVASTYMRYGAPGMPAFLFSECLRKYTQARGMVIGPALAVAGAAIIAIPLLQTSIFGSNTPPIALSLFFIINLAFESVWAYFYLPPETWQDLPSFTIISQDLHIVWKLGTAGIISTCSDWFAWEYLSFASALLGNQVLAANSVFLASAHFFYSLPSGLRNGAATQVGNYLGRNSPVNARIASNTAMLLGSAIATTTGLLMLLNADSWARVFTDDPEVLLIVQQVIPWFAIIVAADAIQGQFSGILQGAGLPMEIARAMVICHWFFGIPLATFLAFMVFQNGLLGLWLGFGIGLVMVCAYETWTILKCNWAQAAAMAQNHMEASDKRAKALATMS